MIAGPGTKAETLPATVLVSLPSRMAVVLKPEYLGTDLRTVVFQPGQDSGPEACPLSTLKVAIEYGVRQLLQDRMARGATQHEKVELLRDGLRRFRLGTIGLRKNGVSGAKASSDPLRKFVRNDPVYKAKIEAAAAKVMPKPKGKVTEAAKAAWLAETEKQLDRLIEAAGPALRAQMEENQRRAAALASSLADF